VRRGLLTADEAAHSSMRNVITRAVGTAEHVEVDTVEWPIVVGDVYLLTTDGLTREVPDSEIANILSTSSDPTRSCETLISAANSAGGRDNISCIVVQVADR
jgi:PPM family protein phosphatase